MFEFFLLLFEFFIFSNFVILNTAQNPQNFAKTNTFHHTIVLPLLLQQKPPPTEHPAHYPRQAPCYQDNNLTKYSFCGILWLRQTARAVLWSFHFRSAQRQNDAWSLCLFISFRSPPCNYALLILLVFPLLA